MKIRFKLNFTKSHDYVGLFEMLEIVFNIWWYVREGNSKSDWTVISLWWKLTKLVKQLKHLKRVKILCIDFKNSLKCCLGKIECNKTWVLCRKPSLDNTLNERNVWMNVKLLFKKFEIRFFLWLFCAFPHPSVPDAVVYFTDDDV